MFQDLRISVRSNCAARLCHSSLFMPDRTSTILSSGIPTLRARFLMAKDEDIRTSIVRYTRPRTNGFSQVFHFDPSRDAKPVESDEISTAIPLLFAAATASQKLAHMYP